jgi:AraC-like DNA-binding protein
MKLFIRNMVCNRCKMVVKNELVSAGLHPDSVELGEVSIKEELTETEKLQLNKRLNVLGFELIDDKRSRLIEKIKNNIVHLVHHSDENLKTNFSEYLSLSLNHDYSYLSKLFSEVEGTTIEKYFIEQKIERVKELLVYDELTLSEIAFDMGYSTVAHLSNQFKKVTGFSPSHFKKLKENKRKPIEEI